MKKAFILLFFLAISLSVSVAYSSVYKNYTTADGLLTESIKKIAAQDENIFLLNTSGRFQYFYGAWVDPQVSNVIDFAVKNDSAVYLLKNDGVYLFTPADGVQQLFSLSQGYAGIAYYSGNLYLFSGKSVTKYDLTGNSSPPVDFAADINNMYSADTLYVLTTSGAYEYQDTNIVLGSSGLNVKDMVKDDSGTYLACSAGVYFFGTGLNSAFTNASAIAKNNNMLIIGTDKGIYLYDTSEDTLYTKYDAANLLYDNDITTLSVDAAGKIWSGSANGGVFVADPAWDYISSSYLTLPLNNTTISNEFLGNTVDKLFLLGDTLWLTFSDGGGKKGCGYFDIKGRVFRGFGNANGIPDTINSIVRGADSAVYLAADTGLVKYSGDSFADVSGWGGGVITALAVKDTYIYIGTEADTYIWRYSSAAGFETAAVFGKKVNIMKNIGGAGGKIYIGAVDGLYTLANGTLSLLDSGLQGKDIISLAGDQFDLWIGSSTKGLFHYSNGKLETIGYGTTNTAPAASYISDITIKNGIVWVANGAGGLNIGKQDGTYNFFSALSSAEGLNSSIINSVAAGDNEIFIGTVNSGLAIFRPSLVKPQLKINEAPEGVYLVYPISQTNIAGTVVYQSTVWVDYKAYDYYTPGGALFYKITTQSNEIITTATKGNISIYSGQGDNVFLKITAYNKFLNSAVKRLDFKLYFYSDTDGADFSTQNGNFKVSVPPGTMDETTKISFVDDAADTGQIKILPADAVFSNDLTIQWQHPANSAMYVTRDNAAVPYTISGSKLYFSVTSGGTYKIVSGSPPAQADKAFSVKINPRILTSENRGAYFIISGKAGEPVDAIVFDISGHIIKRVFESRQSTGQLTYFWNGRDESRAKVLNGFYILYVRAGSSTSKKGFAVRWRE